MIIRTGRRCCGRGRETLAPHGFAAVVGRAGWVIGRAACSDAGLVPGMATKGRCLLVVAALGDVMVGPGRWVVSSVTVNAAWIERSYSTTRRAAGMSMWRSRHMLKTGARATVKTPTARVAAIVAPVSDAVTAMSGRTRGTVV